MKAIIADDERKICQLIEALADWKKFGIEIAGTASNGIEAIELVNRENPDIVLTDIMMPGCDGLEMIRQIRETNPDIRFVIISGYQDFEYARKAIRYGVQDFLTKPVQKSELEAVLKKITVEKEESDRYRENVEHLKNTVLKHTEQMKQSFLHSVLDETQWNEGKNSIEEINRTYNCNFRDGLFRIFIIKPDFDEMEEDGIVYQRLSEKAREISLKEFGSVCFEVIADRQDIGTCVLLNYPRSGIDELRWRFKHIRQSVASSHGTFNETHVTTGVGCEVDDINLIRRSYLGAERAVFNRIILGTDKMIGVSDSEVDLQETFNPFEELESGFKGSFLEATDLFNVDAIREMLESLKGVCIGNAKCDGYSIFTALNELFRLFVMRLKKNKIYGNEEGMLREFRNVFLSCRNVEDVFSRTEELMEKLIGEEIEENRQIEIKPIQQAKAYVQQHYKETITLKEISELTGFNANYFSEIFKKKTDKTLTEYILEVRIEKARELLKNMDIKINEIPEMVGMGDAKYFAKQFKKVTGLTPSKYRKFFG